MDSTRLVYSTEKGSICPSCQRPSSQCKCKKKKPSSQTSIKYDGIIRICREVKGRKGKTVTTLSGFEKVVISAGGIGTPVILRASGLKRAGYDFFFDPLIGVRGTVKDIDVPTSEIPMTAGVHIEEEGYMMTDMAHPFATTAMFVCDCSVIPEAWGLPPTTTIIGLGKHLAKYLSP